MAKRGKPYLDGEMVKEAILAAVENICPDKVSQFQSISLSRRTVTRRIEHISDDLHAQLMKELTKASYFSLALDESTDSADTAQLAVFIRAYTEDGSIIEELAKLCSMHGTTTGKDIFEEVKKCITELQLQWKKLVSATTDGAPSMTGFCGLLKEKLQKEGLPMPMTFHCIIHQQNLCAKTLQMADVMATIKKQ
ncbi:general transcription factor II-I repeat domain-containing protein 2-like [Watersipora subatra]|uniref:general transcription factor II-I repeat domain-containing protein 2-like n=1 Tax=Watersipora subatra TaxID=2589382 RepID=UPI00355BB86C